MTAGAVEIQPHGVFIALASDRPVVVACSANAGELFGVSADAVPGRDVSTFFVPSEALDVICAGKPTGRAAQHMSSWQHPMELTTRSGMTCAGLIKATSSSRLLELFPQREVGGANEPPIALRNRLAYEVTECPDLESLVAVAVDIFKDLTGYDHAFAYQWGARGLGHVLAASSADVLDLGSYWYQHQFRDVLDLPITMAAGSIDVVRMVVDADADPVPLLHANDSSPPDIGPAQLALAAPTPQHIKFLRHAGYRASLTTHIIFDGQPWGFIMALNKQPAQLSAAAIQVGDVLAHVLPVSISRLQQSTILARTVAAERLSYDLERDFSGSSRLIDNLADNSDRLLERVDADALVLKIGDSFVEIGEVPIPPLEFLKLRDKLDEGVAMANRLSELLDMNPQQIRTSAGGAYLELGDDGEDYVFFVRREEQSELRWIRNGHAPDLPRDTVVGDDGEDDAISIATIAGESRVFLPYEADVFRILRRALFAMRSAELREMADRARLAADRDRARLRASLTESLQANVVGEVASALSHELNQPLTAIANYVGAARKRLRDRDDSTDVRVIDAMDAAISQAERAGDLIHRLRRLVEQGDLELEPIEIKPFVDTAVALVTDLLGLTPGQIECVIAPNLPELMADDLQVEQVLVNLLRNAFQAMEGKIAPRAALNVALDRSKAYVTFRLRDYGPGLSAEVEHTLFRPFYSTRRSGMGIGLALCASIVKAHGGTIAAANWEHGAEFSFSLPVDAADQ